MKTITNKFTHKKDCKHSIVFACIDEDALASAIYINKSVIPVGTIECKITVSFPDGKQVDE